MRMPNTQAGPWAQRTHPLVRSTHPHQRGEEEVFRSLRSLKENIPPLFPVLFSWPKFIGHADGTEVMARNYGKPSYHRSFRLREVRISPVIVLSTLDANLALTGPATGNADGAYRCVSISAAWDLLALTAGDGPLVVGYAFSDYTVTEIKECIEAKAAISVGNKIALEQANRLVRVVGTLQEAGGDELNDGRPIKTRLNWLIPIGKEVNIFAYNDGQQLTTGAVAKCTGSMWVKDSS